ncbi:MAG TPA: DNA replication and repair protein RecF [Candidatus Babeliales bacterium]|nr:DNA replication and repair protein RecF [Candidatus Babeliales bacterium]
MHLQQLHIKNFRCFTQKTISFPSKITLIEGLNGSGKTSLLESIHYLCYLRSFRTHAPRELLQFGHDTFFLKAQLVPESDGITSHETELQVGFSGKKRLVKINQKGISSYKELMDHYRVVTLTEDDLSIISGSPQERRAFIDHVLLLYDADFAQASHSLRHIVTSRNRALQSGVLDKTMYHILTQQLWQASRIVQSHRRRGLERLQTETTTIIHNFFDDAPHITFDYNEALTDGHATLEAFLADRPTLYADELRYRRSLFGAHLDDILIKFYEKRSRMFASRGQQKLIILLLKLAQMSELARTRGQAIFLLDDFMTDFDEKRAHIFMKVLQGLGNQIIFTSPLKQGFLHDILLEAGAGQVVLTD